MPHRSAPRPMPGFTLIEMMIVVVIIGILAMIAIPMYTNYTLKAKFSEVMLATSADKIVVDLCAQDGSCVNTAGTGIDLSVSGAPPIADGASFLTTKYVKALNHDNQGVITAESTGGATVGTAGIGAASLTTQGFDASYSYVLTPTLAGATSGGGGRLDWAVSGTCKTRATGSLC